MSDSTEEFEGGYPPVQYAFFTPEGGQWVFRGSNVASVRANVQELLEEADETDGPGLLADLQQLKAAGLLKESTSKGGNSSGGSSSAGGDSGLPAWVLPEASKLLGREVSASEVASGKTKTGKNIGKPWYRVGDTFINPPRNQG